LYIVLFISVHRIQSLHKNSRSTWSNKNHELRGIVTRGSSENHQDAVRVLRRYRQSTDL